MKLFTPAVRISSILVLFTLTILLAADSIFKFSEDSTNTRVEVRKILCEILVYQASFLVSNGEEDTLTEFIIGTVENNPDVLSMALHDTLGRVSVVAGEHKNHWIDLAQDKSTLVQAQLPVFDGEDRWGTLQVRFKSDGLSGALHLLQHPFIKLTLFVCLFGFLVYLWFIKKTLQYLDPSALIPERVKSALDSLAEGVIFIDMEERIVLANSNFETALNQSMSGLMGKKVSELNWKIPKSEQANYQFPWLETLKEGQRKLGSYLVLVKDSGEELSLNVNSSTIYGGKGEIRGAIVSFSDVTELERSNEQLNVTMEALKDANKEMVLQNIELEKLASRDPLTGCLNRRAFFEVIGSEYFKLIDEGRSICCIMGDIDHFKKFNDTYGHAVGDEVIKVVVKAINSSLRPDDLFCRYGGEEFCIMLLDTSIEQAAEIAERMRSTVETQAGKGIRTTSGVNITSSFGVSSTNFGAPSPERLIDEADQALYISKDRGRNIVSIWQKPEEIKAVS